MSKQKKKLIYTFYYKIHCSWISKSRISKYSYEWYGTDQQVDKPHSKRVAIHVHVLIYIYFFLLTKNLHTRHSLWMHHNIMFLCTSYYLIPYNFFLNFELIFSLYVCICVNFTSRMIQLFIHHFSPKVSNLLYNHQKHITHFMFMLMKMYVFFHWNTCFDLKKKKNHKKEN
jgi:hypothetical protein